MDEHKRRELSNFIYFNMKHYGEIIGPAILGTILYFISFGCLYYWKELIVIYFKHKAFPSEGYYPVLKDLMTYIKKMFFFSFFILLSMVVITNIQEGIYSILYPGWYICMTTILLYNSYFYLYKRDRFDLFDDIIFLFNYFKKSLFQVPEKIKVD